MTVSTPPNPAVAATPTLAQVRQLLEALPCAALLLEGDGTLALVNDRAAELLGGGAATLAGVNVLSLYRDPAARQKLADSLARPDAHGEVETTLPRPDGTVVAVIASYNRIRLADRDGGLRLVTLVDIHKLKDSEASLKFQQEFLVQMSDTVMQQALSLKELNDRLEQRVARRTAELRDANMDAIYMLAVAAEAKDFDTGAHVLRIQRYAQALAARLGMDESSAEEIGYSAVLHDVGKLHVPDSILSKPGPLTDEERRTVEQHTVVGERILSTRPFFRRARLIARSHHENWDGTGYPDGLAGQAIPIEARITHVADVFDALTTQRAYKDAWDVTTAMRMIRESAGQLFDPDVAAALSALHDAGELQPLATGFCDLPARNG